MPLKVAASLLPIGLVLVAAAFLLLARGPAGFSTDNLDAAGHAEGVALERLREMSAASCFEGAVLDWDSGWLYEQADALPSTQRWLDEGGLAYVGDLEGMVASLEGELVGRESGKAWVGLTESAGPAVVRIQEFTSPKGRSIWVVIRKERPPSNQICED